MKKLISIIISIVTIITCAALPVFAGEGAPPPDGGAGSISWGLVIIVPLIIAIIACLVASGSMKSVYTASSAKHYEREGSFKLSHKNDRYVRTTERRIHHERNRQ